MGNLWQLCPVVPLPSPACAGTSWGQGFPPWLCLCCSSSPGAPKAQPNLLSPPSSQLITRAGRGICSSVVVGYPKYLKYLCHEMSALKSSHQFCLGARDHELSFAPCRSSSGFGNQGCFWMPGCWYSMGLLSGHNQGAGGQS